MVDGLLRMLVAITVALIAVLLLRRPVRRGFGASPAFALWALPAVLMFAPWLPLRATPAFAWALPAVRVAPGAAATPMAANVDWSAWLVALWVVGAVLALVRLGIAYGRLSAAARPAPVALVAEVRSWLPGFDARRIRMHAAGPAVLCALPRSKLLLPADFAQRFDRDARSEPVLRHEWMHLHRGDPWWSLAMEVASALLWFHPLAWFARSRFRLDQELACDAAVLRGLRRPPAAYARALLDSVAAGPTPALIPWLTEPQLKERIAMLARNVPGALRRRAGFLAVAAVLAGGLFLAGGRVPIAAATAPPALPGAVTGHAATGTTPPSVDVSDKNRNPPAYPLDAIRNGEQGTVILKVTVSAAGAVTHLAIDPDGTTAAPQLQAVALTAAGGWKFNPGSSHGKPVGGVVTIPVRFSLQGENGKSYAPPCGSNSQYVAQIKQCVKLVQPAATAG